MRQGIKLLREPFGVGVDSPETLPGVEGLTDGHFIEVDEGVYMKFKHAYVLVGVSKQEIELLDPHGDNKLKNQKIYEPTIKVRLEQLNTLLNRLKRELQEDQYNSFSIETKEEMDKIFDSLKKYIKGKTALNNLSKKWNYLRNRKELIEENGQVVGLRGKIGKNVLEELMKEQELFQKEDISKGFTFSDKLVEGSQFLHYTTLMKNFQTIRFNKIQ